MPIDMNDTKTIECVTCKHVWVQPAPDGRCPVCHSDRTRLVEERVNKLPRV